MLLNVEKSLQDFIKRVVLGACLLVLVLMALLTRVPQGSTHLRTEMPVQLAKPPLYTALIAPSKPSLASPAFESPPYWPQLGTFRLESAQILVSDGKSFLFEEVEQAYYRFFLTSKNEQAVEMIYRNEQAHFELKKTAWLESPNVLRQRVEIIRKVPGLSVYIFLNPSYDFDVASALVRSGSENNNSLVVWNQNAAQVLVATLPFKRASAAYVGAADGLNDLRDNYNLDQSFKYAEAGDVRLIAEVGHNPARKKVNFDFTIARARTPQEAFTLARSHLQKK